MTEAKTIDLSHFVTTSETLPEISDPSARLMELDNLPPKFRRAPLRSVPSLYLGYNGHLAYKVSDVHQTGGVPI